MLKKVYWVLLVGYVFFCEVRADTEDIDYPTLNSSWTYCFEYTWLGPEYDSTTGYNGTCDDYKDEFRAGDNIPCASPLVISEDGSIPDINYLWTYHRASVLCRKAENQDCVTYTYWYKGLITNQTHMCARIKSDAETTSNGCYKQTDSGYDVELCICKSRSGLANMPCNSGATRFSLSFGAIIVAMLINWRARFF